MTSTSEIEAALVGDDHTILIAAGEYLLSQTLRITRDVTLRAQAPGHVVLHGQNTVRVLRVESAHVSIEGLNITGGHAQVRGNWPNPHAALASALRRRRRRRAPRTDRQHTRLPLCAASLSPAPASMRSPPQQSP